MIAFQDMEMIKVMTGVRRCGKSSLMKLMAGLQQKYITALALAGAYILLYVVVWCVILGLRKKRVVT